MKASEYFANEKARVKDSFTSAALTTGIIITCLIGILLAIRCIIASTC